MAGELGDHSARTRGGVLLPKQVQALVAYLARIDRRNASDEERAIRYTIRKRGMGLSKSPSSQPENSGNGFALSMRGKILLFRCSYFHLGSRQAQGNYRSRSSPGLYVQG
jgi:hypothetical protein